MKKRHVLSNLTLASALMLAPLCAGTVSAAEGADHGLSQVEQSGANGGFEIGGYNSQDVYPSPYNQTGVSRFKGLSDSYEKVWEYALPLGTSESGPTVDKDGNIYVGELTFPKFTHGYDQKEYDEQTKEQYVYSLDKDGKLRWKTNVRGIRSMPPVISSQGIIYALSAWDFTLYALDPASGSIRWKQQVTTPDMSSVIDSDQSTYWLDGWHLYHLSPTGQQLWSVNMVPSNDIQIRSWTLLASSNSGVLYTTLYNFTTGESTVTAYNREGQPLWTTPAVKDFLVNGPIVDAADNVYFPSQHGTVYAFDKNGKPLWTYKTDGACLSSLSLGLNGLLYFKTNNQFVYGLDLHGKLQFKSDLNVNSSSTDDSLSYSAPIIDADGNVYVHDLLDEKTVVYSAEGRRLFDVAGGYPVLSGDGELLTVTRDALIKYHSVPKKDKPVQGGDGKPNPGDDDSTGPAPAPFADVAPDFWAAATIQWAQQHKIAQGYDDNTFHPDDTVTEEQFLAILLRSFGVAAKEDGAGSWSADYYTLAKTKNYPVTGNREADISRRTVAEIIAATQGKNYSGNDAIQYMLGSGLSEGKDSPTIQGYAGGDTLTRAEAVQFIRNVLTKIATKELHARPESPSAAAELPPLPHSK